MKHAADDGKGKGEGASLLSLPPPIVPRARFIPPSGLHPARHPNKASAEEGGQKMLGRCEI